jgi:hypothetical protein
MHRSDVTSSLMKSAGYDDSTRTLEIEFRHGGIYQYEQVPAALYAALLHACSKGSFFHQHIQGIFRFNRISARR